MTNERFFNLVPSVGGSFSNGWSTIFGKAFLPLLLTVLILGLLTGPGVGFNFDKHDSWGPALLLFPLALLGLAYAFLFLPVIKYGAALINVQAVRGEEVDLKTLFEGFKTSYLNIVLANLIVAALIGLGTVMLIIPGIIVACRLAFVSYLVMDKKMDAMKAIEKSWHMTRGHGWKIFGMAILSFFIYIAGFIVIFVGVIISSMWVKAAFASIYQAVLNQSDDENPIPILGVNEV